MPIPQQKQSGISMMEMMIVLAIIAILAVASVSMIGNRPAAAVRSVLDELEGTLSVAHGAAVATGRDIAVVTWGSYENPPLIVAHADSALANTAVQTAATDILTGNLPSATVPFARTTAVPFHPALNDITHSRAKIVMRDSTDWAAAMTATETGASNEDIATIVPFKTGAAMADILGTADNFLFNNAVNRVVISGSNKRFTANVVIQIVGISGNGLPIPGGPMGMLVVQANGASIYKFYNPGIRDGNGKWRRL
jgi:prepilin-type N-terminal cleavage/methylation domain-containing protein